MENALTLLLSKIKGLPLLVLLLGLSLLTQAAVAFESDLADDEELQFFPTAAVLNADENVWLVPIHGWTYERERSYARLRVFEEVLDVSFDLQPTERTRSNFEQRVNMLIADNERNKSVIVMVGNEGYEMPVSGANGHFLGQIKLPVEQVGDLVENGVIRYQARARDGREFAGSSLLLPAQGLSVISDIDDTVKLTNVLNRRELLSATFLEDFVAVPGMAEAYRRMAARGARFHFVSSSPWQLFSPLLKMMHDENFPWATFHLKTVRFRDSSLFNLFKPGTETKPLQIEALLDNFPKREFILIGDSGEADPEVYAGILRDYPQHVRHIFIRNITGETLDNARFETLVDDSSQWTLFTDPAVIR